MRDTNKPNALTRLKQKKKSGECFYLDMDKIGILF